MAYTPGLPQITNFFGISVASAQFTLTLYLIGYTVGQLLYGPLANRFGSRSAITLGVLLEIIGALLCILASPFHSFALLLVARLIMALGAAVGLKMTFNLVSNLFSQQESAKIISLLTIAFAITPGLGVLIGGILVTHYGWESPFILMAIYGFILLILGPTLPEAYPERQSDALKLKPLLTGYRMQFTSQKIVCGGLLISMGTCIIYIFASLAPFIAIRTMGLSPDVYGIYNFLPALGILLGSLAASYFGKYWKISFMLYFGLTIASAGIILLLICLTLFSHPLSLFLPCIIIYFGFSLIYGNGTALALSYAADKSNGSAVFELY